MTIEAKHTTQATGTDAGDGEIGKTAWNQNHTLAMATNHLLGASTPGPVQEIQLGTGISLSGGVLTAASDTSWSLIQTTILTESGNWTPQPDTKMVYFELIGGGGGGAGGWTRATSVNSFGGGGGAAGLVTLAWFPRSVIQAPCACVVGAGGVGGAGAGGSGVDSSTRNAGEAGGNTSLTVAPGIVVTTHGGPGAFGAFGEGGGSTFQISSSAMFHGSGGGSGTTSTQNAGSGRGLSPGGGGAGTGINSSNVNATISGSGGLSRRGFFAINAAGTIGTATAASSPDGANGATVPGAYGNGGAGGQGRLTIGGNGGNGGTPAGGGGGGGSTRTDFVPGNGGNGGRGEIRIWEFG